MTSRREFLVLLATSTAAIATGKALQLPAEKNLNLANYKWSMVIQVDKCTECITKLLEKEGIKNFDDLSLDEQNEVLRKLRPPCVKACDLTNNVPRYSNPYWDCHLIRIIGAKATENAAWRFFPILCQECEHPACVEVCPTKASYKRPDGIVVIDLHRCIGCRYCMVACPYNARSFTFKDPLPDLKKINPETPVRKDGVPMKCEFCRWLIDQERCEGKNPKPVCVEVCPYNALVFGNLKDPNSEVSKIVRTSKVIRLRGNLGTDPKVFYHNL